MSQRWQTKANAIDFPRHVTGVPFKSLDLNYLPNSKGEANFWEAHQEDAFVSRNALVVEQDAESASHVLAGLAETQGTFT